MSKNIIDKEQFDKWAKVSYQHYASEHIPSKGRLIFKVNLKGEFKVILSGDILYQGYNFDEAAKAYHTIPYGM